MSWLRRNYLIITVLCVLISATLLHDGQVSTVPHSGKIRVNIQPTLELYTYEPLTFRNEQWFNSTFWTGPDWTRVGKDWQHSGLEVSPSRSFICPLDGLLTITGWVRKADINGGDGIRAYIRHQSSTIWNAEIDGKDAVGVKHNIRLKVHKGDVLRFIVLRRGSIECDSTYWNPEIAYDGGPQFLASEGFSSTIDASSPWRYEMDTTSSHIDAEDFAVSRLYTFTSDLLPRNWNLDGKTAQVKLSSKGNLPFVIITRRYELGGTLVLLKDANNNWNMDVSAPDEDGKVTVAWRSSKGTPLVTTFIGDWKKALESPDLDNIFKAAFKHQKSAVDIPAMQPKLWAMVTEAWFQEDGHPSTSAEFSASAKKHLKSSLMLADRLIDTPKAGFAGKALKRVRLLLNNKQIAHGDVHKAEQMYIEARRIKRELMLSRPEMSFNKLLFCKQSPPSYSHLVMQYFGWRARSGGGLFILDHPGYSLNARDILDGRLAKGSVLQPCLDWNGKRIIFSYVKNASRNFNIEELDNKKDDGFYHIWSVNTDGSGLRQLTRGAYDDTMPVLLPDGDIIFCSTRRKGYSRCFGPQFSNRWHSYTLHRRSAKTGEISLLSYNDVSEWFPVVSNDGTVYYSRWDYIDRDAVTHQALWSSRPDGTNPMAIWGNALPSPHCTFQVQPIPGSRKFVFVASAHHSITGGSLVVLDPEKGENSLDAIQRITPEVPFPEAESMNIKEWYAAPWPLAEDLFLTAYSPYPLVWEPGANRTNALGIYLIDAVGNRELIYRDPEIGATNPIPLRARMKPPVVTSLLDPRMGDSGEFFIADVYDGLKGVVNRGDVKELRVVQIFPKITPVVNTPPIGLAGEENPRAVLGTVPVAEDGSVRFKAPARKPLLFHLLDKDGRSVQIMRSLTYLQPGEKTSCVGCHEGRGKIIRNITTKAGANKPHTITPGQFDGKPFSFMTVVQPILNKNCIQCHSGAAPPRGIDLTGTPDRGFTRSYLALLQDVDTRRSVEVGQAVEPLVPRYAARNQIQITQPGGVNTSRGSLLLKMLDKGHNNVSLSIDEKRLLAMWIDCNAIFYGASLPEQQERQLRGEDIPMPEIE